MPSRSDPQKAMEAKVKVGQKWIDDDEVFEVLELVPGLGARVRVLKGAGEGRTFNYTFRSFASWQLMASDAPAGKEGDRG